MSLTMQHLTDTALDTRVMVTRSVRRSLRDPEAFFTALMLPVILMLLFVYVFGGAMRTGTSYVDYVVPGLIVLCAGFGAGTTATAVAQDMTNGIVDRFRSMPVTPSSVLSGHVVASLLRNLLATLLVICVGLAVGWRPDRIGARLARRDRSSWCCSSSRCRGSPPRWDCSPAARRRPTA